ncbi:MAG: hypothetical protein ACRCY8_16305 [Dermatophilaceae bacterium]
MTPASPTLGSMRHISRTVADILLRAAAVTATTWGTFELVDLASGPVVGANIGAGLFAYVALVAAAAAGGGIDGRFRPPLRRGLAVWAGVAVVVAVVLPALSQLGAPGMDLDVYLADVLELGWFDAAAVFGPAAFGLLLGHAIRDARRPTPHGPPTSDLP